MQQSCCPYGFLIKTGSDQTVNPVWLNQHPHSVPLSLFVSTAPSLPGMIISYHVFICLIHPSPQHHWHPLLMHCSCQSGIPHTPVLFLCPHPLPSPPSSSPATMGGCCFHSLSASSGVKPPSSCFYPHPPPPSCMWLANLHAHYK